MKVGQKVFYIIPPVRFNSKMSPGVVLDAVVLSVGDDCVFLYEDGKTKLFKKPEVFTTMEEAKNYLSTLKPLEV